MRECEPSILEIDSTDLFVVSLRLVADPETTIDVRKLPMIYFHQFGLSWPLLLLLILFVVQLTLIQVAMGSGSSCVVLLLMVVMLMQFLLAAFVLLASATESDFVNIVVTPVPEVNIGSMEGHNCCV